MKKVRLFNHYQNGNQSKVNVYFADGTEWHRAVLGTDVERLSHEGESYLGVLMEKYAEVQPWANRYGRR